MRSTGHRHPSPPRLSVFVAAPAPTLRRSCLARVGGFWRGLCGAVARLEDHWLGDLIGVVSLFGVLWMFLLFGHALGGTP